MRPTGHHDPGHLAAWRGDQDPPPPALLPPLCGPVPDGGRPDQAVLLRGRDRHTNTGTNRMNISDDFDLQCQCWQAEIKDHLVKAKEYRAKADAALDPRDRRRALSCAEGRERHAATTAEHMAGVIARARLKA